MSKTPEYDLESMIRLILKCEENIKVFEAAIAAEKENKTKYEHVVKTLKEKASHPPPVVRIDAKKQEIFPDEDKSSIDS